MNATDSSSFFILKHFHPLIAVGIILLTACGLSLTILSAVIAQAVQNPEPEINSIRLTFITPGSLTAEFNDPENIPTS
jgi:hypothetical protein